MRTWIIKLSKYQNITNLAICNSQILEINQMSIKGEWISKLCSTHSMESVVKLKNAGWSRGCNKKKWTSETYYTRNKFQNGFASGRGQMKWTAYCIILFIYSYKILDNVSLSTITESMSVSALEWKEGVEKGLTGEQGNFGKW